MTPEHLSAAISAAYRERCDLLVVALTGRTGSGCSTAAHVLASEFADIHLPLDSLPKVEQRKYGKIKDYASSEWVAATRLTVSAVIYSFVLQAEPSEVVKLLDSQGVSEIIAEEVRRELESSRAAAEFPRFSSEIDTQEGEDSAWMWGVYAELIDSSAGRFKSLLGALYPSVMQVIGNNLRHSGSAVCAEVRLEALFSLVRRVKRLAKAAFYYRNNTGQTRTLVVIDAIRNPLELIYLRDQFAAFFALAITADDSERRARLQGLNYTAAQIVELDKVEYSRKHLQSYSDFVSQSVKDCIQKSDLFIANPNMGSFQQPILLNLQLVRYWVLMHHPGLVTPSQDERCMQLAFVAKLNSGCVSRQVGAVVADSNYAVRAVGWNDVPKGQVPCLLRDARSLLRGEDSSAFSDFERSDPEFRDSVRSLSKGKDWSELDMKAGCPFCFKDAFNKSRGEKNQVHTRSLHAEENAFLQIAKSSGGSVDGGVLFTTASPCELCSKKAFQMGMSEIVYIDPYPGISSSHVLASGEGSLRPRLRLFSGAVGHAYHRLYDSIFPIKDETVVRLSSGRA